MIPLRHICGCSQERPCARGAMLFDRGLMRRLALHLEQTIQVNRPYEVEVAPATKRTLQSFATLGEIARVR